MTTPQGVSAIFRRPTTGPTVRARLKPALLSAIAGRSCGPETISGTMAMHVELERRLLDQALDAQFIDARERALAARPDRMGLGAGG